MPQNVTVGLKETIIHCTKAISDAMHVKCLDTEKCCTGITDNRNLIYGSGKTYILFKRLIEFPFGHSTIYGLHRV